MPSQSFTVDFPLSNMSVSWSWVWVAFSTQKCYVRRELVRSLEAPKSSAFSGLSGPASSATSEFWDVSNTRHRKQLGDAFNDHWLSRRFSKFWNYPLGGRHNDERFTRSPQGEWKPAVGLPKEPPTTGRCAKSWWQQLQELKRIREQKWLEGILEYGITMIDNLVYFINGVGPPCKSSWLDQWCEIPNCKDHVEACNKWTPFRLPPGMQHTIKTSQLMRITGNWDSLRTKFVVWTHTRPCGYIGRLAFNSIYTLRAFFCSWSPCSSTFIINSRDSFAEHAIRHLKLNASWCRL